MITCPNCQKENQDHYKFCLGCGARLGAAGVGGSPPPPPAVGPALGPQAGAVKAAPVPPAPLAPSAPQGGFSGLSPAPGIPAPPPATGLSQPGLREPGAPSYIQTSPSASLPNQGVAPGCTACGFVSPPGFSFCGRCGHRLGTPASTDSAELAAAPTMFAVNDPAASSAVGGALEPAGSPLSARTNSAPGIAATPAMPPSVPAAVPAAPASAAQATTPLRLVLLGPDGQPLGERVLAPTEALEVGRSMGPPWDDDAYLDPHHATLRVAPEGLEIDDKGSLNGVFVKLVGRAELHNGDQFRVGQELLRYDEIPEPTPASDGTERMGSPNPGYWGRLSVLVEPTIAESAYPIASESMLIGRESGDVTFPQDGYVSGKHCRVFGDDTGIYLEDLGSSNGTYLRVRPRQVVPVGSYVLIGQKLFELQRV